MKTIQIDLTRSQYDQLANLIAKTRSIIQGHQTGEVSVATQPNKIGIEWTAQGVEINIPD